MPEILCIIDSRNYFMEIFTTIQAEKEENALCPKQSMIIFTET